MRRAICILLLALAATACGNRAKLEPKQGQSLPVPPYGREVSRPADALLEPAPQSVPERSVELRRRSEEREDDPFDLPPPE